jgi:hypothetical protein
VFKATVSLVTVFPNLIIPWLFKSSIISFFGHTFSRLSIGIDACQHRETTNPLPALLAACCPMQCTRVAERGMKLPVRSFTKGQAPIVYF